MHLDVVAAAAQPADKSSLLDLKSPLKATPEGAELSDFDITIHSNGHPQLLKGKLTFFDADGNVVASTFENLPAPTSDELAQMRAEAARE